MSTKLNLTRKMREAKTDAAEYWRTIDEAIARVHEFNPRTQARRSYQPTHAKRFRAVLAERIKTRSELRKRCAFPILRNDITGDAS